MALRLMRGIAIRDEDPVDLVGQLVETSQFLSSSHTHMDWRDELTVASPLIDRSSYGDQVANGANPADAGEVPDQDQVAVEATEPSEYLEKSLRCTKGALPARAERQAIGGVCE